jgi:hypothetical protein
MRIVAITTFLSLSLAAWAQPPEFKTAEQVLDRYKQALGGEDAIRKVQSITAQAEAEGPSGSKASVTMYGKAFKTLSKVKLPDGTEITSGFDGQTAWTITPKGASIDTDVPVESNRRDADLQYALHQPDYFKKLELAGVVDFEGHRCYWLHGTTHWGKDNNQFYDVETGLLRGYRFQNDSGGSKVVVIALFEDYKDFGGPLMATKNITRAQGKTQTFTFKSVSYAPLDDSMFELPVAVKALLKNKG